jgi:hypothetical protein
MSVKLLDRLCVGQHYGLESATMAPAHEVDDRRITFADPISRSSIRPLEGRNWALAYS